MLYNAVSGLLTEIDDELFSFLKTIEGKTDIRPDKIQDLEISEFLTQNMIIVDNDENTRSKIQLNTLSSRYDTRHLGLTIAPTRDCNFECIYCYEKDRPHTYMTETIQQAVIDFAKSRKSESIHVAWYGGEPLLAKNIIESLTQKFINVVGKDHYSASIITNGYLLDKDFIEQLPLLQIKSLQITVDGLKDTHNQRRPHKDFTNSFDTIISNLVLLANMIETTQNDIQVTIRVNIDKSNLLEYVNVLKMIRAISTRFYVDMGIVRDDSKKLDCLTTSNEKAALYNTLFYEHSVFSLAMFPYLYTHNCMARHLNAFLIDPEGYIYKCWEDIGNPHLSVGNVVSHDEGYFTNLDLVAQYMKTADNIDSSVCTQCRCFPICEGGCPKRRIDNLFHDAKQDVCSVFKNNLYDMIEIRYLTHKMMNENENKK